MEPTKSDQPAPQTGERAKAAGEDGQTKPHTPKTKGIPPLPEPDVEGVGEESGPSAEKTGDKGEKLSSDARKMAEDGTGF